MIEMKDEFYRAVKKVYDMSKSEKIRTWLMENVMTHPDSYCNDCGGEMVDTGSTSDAEYYKCKDCEHQIVLDYDEMR